MSINRMGRKNPLPSSTTVLIICLLGVLAGMAELEKQEGDHVEQGEKE